VRCEPRVTAAQITPKKKSLHDSQRETPRVKRQRRKFRKCVTTELRPRLERLYFLDECGSHLGLTRLYGRARPGQRVVEATTGYSGKHYTTVAAISLAGVCAPFVFAGAMNGLVFATYVQAVLAPVLNAGDILLVDNLSAHRNVEAVAAIEARGARVLYLPPYSPDLNPIELCWAKTKQALRTAKARTFESLIEALCVALRAVAPEHVRAWFKHCGYALA